MTLIVWPARLMIKRTVRRVWQHYVAARGTFPDTPEEELCKVILQAERDQYAKTRPGSTTLSVLDQELGSSTDIPATCFAIIIAWSNKLPGTSLTALAVREEMMGLIETELRKLGR